MKKDFIQAINYAKYVAFVLATICVFIFQMTAQPAWVTVGLSLYVVAFGLMFASMVMHAVEVFEASKAAKKENAIVVEPSVEINEQLEKDSNGEVEVVDLKSEKIWAIVGSVFFGVFTVFTFVVLVLF